MTFVDGVATVTLRDGESATATGLPASMLVNSAMSTELAPVAYTVTETKTEGYEVMIPEAAQGILTEDGSVQVDFVNTALTVPVDPTPAPADPEGPSVIEKVDMQDPASQPGATKIIPATGDSSIAFLVGCLSIVAGIVVLMARRTSFRR